MRSFLQKMEGKEEKPDKKGLHIEVDVMVEKRHKISQSFRPASVLR